MVVLEPKIPAWVVPTVAGCYKARLVFCFVLFYHADLQMQNEACLSGMSNPEEEMGLSSVYDEGHPGFLTAGPPPPISLQPLLSPPGSFARWFIFLGTPQSYSFQGNM